MSLGNTPNENRRILRIAQVEEFSGYKRPTIYKKIKEGSFPRQISLGARAVGWTLQSLIDWQDELIANNEGSK